VLVCQYERRPGGAFLSGVFFSPSFFSKAAPPERLIAHTLKTSSFNAAAQGLPLLGVFYESPSYILYRVSVFSGLFFR